jgi:DNA-binding XRE family transcriptional regulator
VSVELEKLTSAERLLVDRRRRGETQAQAAARHNVSQSRYSRWERGLDEPNDARTVPSIRIKELKPHEKCLLYRRRAGRTQATIAIDLNRCKMWVRQMERGEVDSTELVQYWEQ